MSLLVDHLGYVVLGTPDLKASTDFYHDVCQFEVSEQREGVVFLRGGLDHHWLRLEQRDEPGLIRVGYQVTSPETMTEIKSRLEARGVPWTSDATMRDDRVVGAIRFTEPSGIVVDLYEEMIQMPVAPRRTGVNLEIFLHAVFMVADIEASRDFWREVLDFRRSDQIEEFGVFMRCGNKYHHSVAFLRGTDTKLDHFCILVDSIDDVMRMQGLAKHLGVPLEQEALRHAASGSISTYLGDQKLNIGIEYCTGHGQLEDDYPGRLLLASPATANTWKALPESAAYLAAAPVDNDSRGLVQTVADLLEV